MGVAYTSEAIGFLREYLAHPDRYLPICDTVWESFEDHDYKWPGRPVGWNALDNKSIIGLYYIRP